MSYYRMSAETDDTVRTKTPALQNTYSNRELVLNCKTFRQRRVTTRDI